MPKHVNQGLKKILIVEDEGEMCLLINILLDSKELDLQHVNTIARAKEQLEKEAPDLVILDNRLPDGYGIDFISFVRANYPATRIIMMSGYDGAASDVALENGADEFLEKPFTKEILVRSIHKVLESPMSEPA